MKPPSHDAENRSSFAYGGVKKPQRLVAELFGSLLNEKVFGSLALGRKLLASSEDFIVEKYGHTVYLNTAVRSR